MLSDSLGLFSRHAPPRSSSTLVSSLHKQPPVTSAQIPDATPPPFFLFFFFLMYRVQDFAGSGRGSQMWVFVLRGHVRRSEVAVSARTASFCFFYCNSTRVVLSSFPGTSGGGGESGGRRPRCSECVMLAGEIILCVCRWSFYHFFPLHLNYLLFARYCRSLRVSLAGDDHDAGSRRVQS